jgi:multiple sugar transport system substrate-binding protein
MSHKVSKFLQIAFVFVTIFALLSGCAPAATPTAAPTEPPAPTAVPPTAVPPTAVPPTAVPPTPAPPTAVPPTAVPCPNGSVNITVHDWSSADRIEYWNQVIKAFNDAHPCVYAETVKLPDDRAVRLNELSAGTAPDLVGFDSSDLPRVAGMGFLTDLTMLMQKDNFDPSKEFFDSVYKTGFVAGKPVALDKDYSVSAFYVNTDLLAKAGIDIPKEGWTYDDYLKLAQQLTVDTKGNNALSPDFDPKNVAVWGTSSPYWGGDTGWWRGFQSFLYSWGTHTISADGKTTTGYINSDKALIAWNWYRDLIHKYHVAPSASFLGASGVTNDKLFSDGKLAISGSFWGPWYQDTFNKAPNLKWTAVPLPTGPGGHHAAIMWMGWGINSKTQHPDEAWQLLKWLSTQPGQQVFALKAMTGDKATAAALQQDKDPYWQVFLAEVPYQDQLDDMTTPFYTTCVDTPASKVMGKVFQDTGKTLDIKPELDKLAAEADKCLAESKLQ